MAPPQRDYSLFTFTILNTATDSDTIDLHGMVPVAVSVDGWTAANLSFKASGDPALAVEDVVDVNMAPVVVTGFDAGKFVVLQSSFLHGVRMLQLISSAAQLADRTLSVYARRL